MTAAVKISNLSKVYDNGFEALKGIDLEVRKGDFFALLGPNGAGKSTTIGILCSLVSKSGGSVEIFGINTDLDFSAAKEKIGVVPQEFNFNQFEKVFNVVCTQGGFYGMPPALAAERTGKYLRQLGLWDKRNAQSRMLSGGMKRRLMIARALVHEPELLILDEPTAGVDIELRRSMWQFLRDINEQGTTIILTTHYLEEAESLCRNVAIISQGEIVRSTSIKALLRQMNKEVFIFDAVEELDALPELPGYQGKLVDSHSFELEIEKSQSINQLFGLLTERNIHITSMRNKANRLEELFVSMVESHGLETTPVTEEETEMEESQ